jgi:tryptophan 2,3-dioxygenase
MPNTPLEDAREMLARAEGIAVKVRANEQAIVTMSTEDLEELRKDLADSVASASATIAEIKTLLAARDNA